MNTLLTYLLVGVIFTWTINSLTNIAIKEGLLKTPVEFTLDVIIMCIVLWPILGTLILLGILSGNNGPDNPAY